MKNVQNEELHVYLEFEYQILLLFFSDDSCDELVNSSAQICASNDGLSERSSSRQESSDDSEFK